MCKTVDKCIKLCPFKVGKNTTKSCETKKLVVDRLPLNKNSKEYPSITT